MKRKSYGIEDRKELERVEQQIISQSKFASENPYPVLRVSREGIILYHNKASMPLLLNWQSELGKALPKAWQKIVQETYHSNALKQVEIDCKGQMFLLNLVPVKDNDYLNIYATDITDLKKANEKYATLVENSNDGIIILQDARVKFANAQHG